MLNERQRPSSKKKNTTDFMIEFETLIMKANTDKLYAIFLLKKNV